MPRSDAVADAAQEAFWQAVVDAYPEITSGDLDPLTTNRFDEACRDTVAAWVQANSDNRTGEPDEAKHHHLTDTRGKQDENRDPTGT
jgi:hypothetical protein